MKMIEQEHYAGIKRFVNKQIEHQNTIEVMYPNRHREIHKVHCNGCPSSFGMDEESEDISKYPKELIAKEFLFVCYQRQSKLCKGLCDNMGIDEEYLISIGK